MSRRPVDEGRATGQGQPPAGRTASTDRQTTAPIWCRYPRSMHDGGRLTRLLGSLVAALFAAATAVLVGAIAVIARRPR